MKKKKKFSPNIKEQIQFTVNLDGNTIWGHPLSTYAKVFEKLTFLTPLIRTRTCPYQGVRNVRFLANFAYVPNEGSLLIYKD